MSHFLQVFCYLLLIVSAYGLRSLRAAIHSSRGAQLAQIPRSKIMKRELLPQIAFAATCAGAVFVYVATHIDEIKAKQKVAVDAAMTEQASNIRSAQDKQREAIEKARKQQEEAIRKITEDAKRR